MVWYHGRWHRYSEAERREYGERKREEWRRRWHAQWFSRRGLKARLWTDKAIADFLPGAQPAGRIRAWPRSVVLAAEQTPAFQAWLAKRRAWLDARCRLPGVIYATYGLLAIGWDVSAPDRPVRYQRRVWNEVKQDLADYSHQWADSPFTGAECAGLDPEEVACLVFEWYLRESQKCAR